MVSFLTEKLRRQTLEDVQFEPINQALRRSWDCSTPSAASTGEKSWCLPAIHPDPNNTTTTTTTSNNTSNPQSLTTPTTTSHHPAQHGGAAWGPPPPQHTTILPPPPAPSLPHPPPPGGIRGRQCWEEPPTVSLPQISSQGALHAPASAAIGPGGVGGGGAMSGMIVQGHGLAIQGQALLTFSGQHALQQQQQQQQQQQYSSGLSMAHVCIHSRNLASCGLCNVTVLPGTPTSDPPKKRHCRSLSIPGDGASPGASRNKWQPQASSIWKPVNLRSHLNTSKLLKSRNSPHSLHKGKHRSSPSVSSLNSTSNSNQSPGLPRWSPGYRSGYHSNSQSPGLQGTTSSIASSDTSTPPESPVPRPASASSGFYDSSGASQSSLNTSIWGSETSPNSQHRGSLFRLRSISMEEPSGANVAPSGGGSGVSGGLAPAVDQTFLGSAFRPRCRSQPCVLRSRERSRSGGLKRRRGEEDRPTLDFHKMKETAYMRYSGRARHKSSPYSCESVDGVGVPVRPVRSLASLFASDSMDGFHALDTIASSPLDCGTLNTATPIQQSPDYDDDSSSQEVGGATLTAGGTLTRMSKPPPCFGDVTDSGCSDDGCETDDPPDIVSSFADSSCSDADFPSSHGADYSSSRRNSEEVQVFELEMSSDLDIDQIEKD